jgi:alpha-1,2-mannosyltransferase
VGGFSGSRVVHAHLVTQCSPEKDHTSQIQAFHQFLETYPQYKTEKNVRPRLVLIGGARNEGDITRVDRLRGLVGELGIEVSSFDLSLLSHLRPSLGVRRIRCECALLHSSGVAVQGQYWTEYDGRRTLRDLYSRIHGKRLYLPFPSQLAYPNFQAAGVIPVTHASGGPLKDIVVPLNNEITGACSTPPSASIKSGLRLCSGPVELNHLCTRLPRKDSRRIRRCFSSGVLTGCGGGIGYAA